MKVHILAMAGSTRPASFNRRLLDIAVEGARAAGATVTIVDLHKHPLPIYEREVEIDAYPKSAARLRALLNDHQGLLLASPEYNGSVSPLLKNVIDWTTRNENARRGDTSLYHGKVAALLSASSGRFGGVRGLLHLRDILTTVGCMVLPQQGTLGESYTAFDENGNLVDSARQERITKLGAALADAVARLHG